MIENNHSQKIVYKKELWLAVFARKPVTCCRIYTITDTFYSFLDFNSFSNLRICSKEIYNRNGNDKYEHFLTKQIKSLTTIRMDKIQDFIKKFNLIEEKKSVFEVFSMVQDNVKIYLTIEDCRKLDENSKLKLIFDYPTKINSDVVKKIISTINYRTLLESNKSIEFFKICQLHETFPAFEINIDQMNELEKSFTQCIEKKEYEKMTHLFVWSLFLSSDSMTHVFAEILSQAWKNNRDEKFANVIVDLLNFQTKNKLESSFELSLDSFFFSSESLYIHVKQEKLIVQAFEKRICELEIFEDFNTLCNRMNSFNVIFDEVNNDKPNFLKTAFLNLFSKDASLPQLKVIAYIILEGGGYHFRGSLEPLDPALAPIFFKALSQRLNEKKSIDTYCCFIFSELFPSYSFTEIDSYSEYELTCAVALLNYRCEYQLTLELAKQHSKNFIVLCNHNEAKFTIQIGLDEENEWAAWLLRMLLEYKMEEHKKVLAVAARLEVAFENETMPSKALAIALLNYYDQNSHYLVDGYLKIGHWPLLFEEREALVPLLHIQNNVVLGPNSLYLEDPDEVTKIREEVTVLFEGISRDNSLFIPQVKLNSYDFVKLGGVCLGCSLQIGKALLQNWEEEFEKNVADTATKYSKKATIEGRATHIAYEALFDLQKNWIKLFLAAYQLLDNSEDKAFALYRFAEHTDINKEKVFAFLNRHESDPKVLKQFLWLYENSSNEINTPKEVIDVINTFFLANHIIKGGSLEESLTSEQNKKIARLFKQKKTMPSDQITEIKPLHDVIGIVLKPFSILSKNDVEILEIWSKDAEDGVYKLAFCTSSGKHAIAVAKKKELICFIDPNVPMLEDGKPWILESGTFVKFFYELIKKKYAEGVLGYSFNFAKIELKKEK